MGQTARAYLRAIGGGLLIGLPLLFTQEMWQHAFLLPEWKILVLLAVATVIVVGYNAVSGFRKERSTLQLLLDTIETMGLAIATAAVALVVLGRIDLDTGLRDAAGKIALQTMPIAFGVSLASTQLAAEGGEESEDEDEGQNRGHKPVGAFERLFIAAGGALLFALNIAPTEEPVLLGISAEWWMLLVAMAATYLVTLAIVFYADFRGGRSPEPGDSVLDRPLTETTAAYAISIIVSLLLLWSFGRADGVSLQALAGEVVMLAVVASFGASVGRLLVGGGGDGGGQAEEAAA